MGNNECKGKKMEIKLANQLGENINSQLKSISDWRVAIFPATLKLDDDDEVFLHDFWIGSSKDRNTWVLSRSKSADVGVVSGNPDPLVFLYNPLKPEPTIITEIMVKVYLSTRDGIPDERRIESIINGVPFPEYKPIELLFPDVPTKWLGIPAEWVVGFQLSDGAGVTLTLYGEYERDSLEGVMDIVGGERHPGILINYNLVAREVYPFLTWDVDWPLARRSKDLPAQRTKTQGELPWEEVTNCSLLTIYQYLPIENSTWEIPYYGQPVVRLRVAGLSREDAVRNWHHCAKIIRKVRYSRSNKNMD